MLQFEKKERRSVKAAIAITKRREMSLEFGGKVRKREKEQISSTKKNLQGRGGCDGSVITMTN